MPKKPPFNHFRKSCRSPSNGNKKEKRNYRCRLFPARNVPACPPGGCVGKGSRRGAPGGPASPPSPWHALDLPAPADPFLRAGTCMWHCSSCLSKGCAQRDFPHGQPCLQGQQEPLSPHTRRTRWLGTRGALSLISVSSIEESLVPARWGCRVPYGACGQRGSAVTPGQPDCQGCWGTEKEPVCKQCHEQGTSL